jgi:predicted PurR-regulated permease PerM
VDAALKQQLPKPSPEEPSQAESAVPDGEPVDPVTRRAVLAAWIEDTQLSVYILLILTAGAIYLTYLIFRPFLKSLFVALVMTIVFFPIYKWFSQRFRSSYFAALTTTALALVIVLVPVVLISARLAAEATNVFRSVLGSAGNPATWSGRFDPFLEETARVTGIPVAALKADIALRARQLASWSFVVGTSFGRRFAQQIITIALAFVFLLPLLRNSDEFRRGALSMLPLSRQRARELATAVNQGVIADVYGVVAVGIAEGLLIAFGFWVTGLGSPLVWGAVAAVLSCLPFVGVCLLWIPACVVLALRGNWTNAILLFVWCAVVVSTLEGMVRSSVVSGRARVNSMLVMLSIMGGVVAFGGVGIFVGPVLLVVVGTLVRILREEHASALESRIRAPAPALQNPRQR